MAEALSQTASNHTTHTLHTLTWCLVNSCDNQAMLGYLANKQLFLKYQLLTKNCDPLCCSHCSRVYNAHTIWASEGKLLITPTPSTGRLRL
jgi:hypothetical protein